MKTCFLIAALSFTFLKAYPSRKVEGYIVTLNNDTVQVTIKVFLYDHTTVKIVDSLGKTQVFTPSEIKGYGYTLKLTDYVFRSKPIKDGSLGFLQVVATGSKTSLYKYAAYAGAHSYSDEEFYTFEKPGGSYLFLRNFDRLNTLNEAIKSFYSDCSEVQRIIDNKFQERRKIQKDIKDLVNVVNNS